jgi:hypothetical protein
MIDPTRNYIQTNRGRWFVQTTGMGGICVACDAETAAELDAKHGPLGDVPETSEWPGCAPHREFTARAIFGTHTNAVMRSLLSGEV